jgi:aerobic carbon-monoxide dehydrogenase small subunit
VKDELINEVINEVKEAETTSRIISIRLEVNQQAVSMAVEPNVLLIDLLRDDLHLTGTHQGCDTAQCGACTVLVQGQATKACNVLAVQVDGCQIETIEGLSAANHALHPMQQAFSEHHALQCGYCTPGLVMRAIAMATENVPATKEGVTEALAGNICRCTGYEGIVAAICQGLLVMRGQH